MPPGLPERIELHRVQTREDVAVPRRLLASWQRSEDYGVSLESVDPVFTGTGDLGSLFHQCGSEVLQDLHRTLANEPVGLMLTDAEGVVLSRLSGDRALLQALDDVHLAPASPTPSATSAPTASALRSPTAFRRWSAPISTIRSACAPSRARPCPSSTPRRADSKAAST